MKRILFQGDSITDCGRNRDSLYNLGGGYPKYAAQFLLRLAQQGNQHLLVLRRALFTVIADDVLQLLHNTISVCLFAMFSIPQFTRIEYHRTKGFVRDRAKR